MKAVTLRSRWGMLRAASLASVIVLGLSTSCLAPPAFAGDDSVVARSFEQFCHSWIVKLEQIGKENGSKVDLQADGDTFVGRYVCYGPECESWIKKTDSEKTPYVGCLRYMEKQMQKSGRTRSDALQDPGEVISQLPVTEIFRFTDGRWVY